ncbi:MAG: cell division protein FtsQ/DivIB [Egibacteraceae bacterium]
MTASTSSRRPPVDERFLQRRRAVARDNVIHRRRRTLSLLGLVLLAAGAFAVSRSSLFAITAVRVDGESGPRATAVSEVAGIRRGDNLLSADLEAAAQRVRGLPWVAEAQANRHPPSTVVFDVEPRRPVLAVATGDATVLVDAEGVVVPGAVARGDAVKVRAPNAVVPGPGVEVSDAAVRTALAAHLALPARVRDAVVAYEAPSERGLRVRLRLDRLDGPRRSQRLGDTVWVRVGTAERMGDKRQVLLALLTQVASQRTPSAIAEIDVRAPDHPVIVPQG